MNLNVLCGKNKKRLTFANRFNCQPTTVNYSLSFQFRQFQ